MSEVDFPKLKERIKEQDRLKFVVVSGSMLPLLQIGEVVEVERLEGVPERFDILVFYDGKKMICHFLWHINSSIGADGSTTYVTSGLRSWPQVDLPVSSTQVLGKIISHKISNFMRLRLYFLALIHRFLRLSQKR